MIFKKTGGGYATEGSGCGAKSNRKRGYSAQTSPDPAGTCLLIQF